MMKANPRLGEGNYLQDIAHCTNVDDPAKRLELLEFHHKLGHFGTKVLIKSLVNSGHRWSTMVQDAGEYIKACTACQRYVIQKQGFHPLTPITASLPWDHVAMDLFQFSTVSERGMSFVLIIVDVFTRFVILRAIPDKRAETIAQTLFQVFCDLGFPRIIQSDNGTEFHNQIVAILVQMIRAEHRFSTPYHPRGNGLAEVNVKSAKDILLKTCEGKLNDWDLHVPFAQYCHNIREASFHGTSAFTLMFARKFNHFGDFRNVVSKPPDMTQFEERMRFIQGIVYPSIRDKEKGVSDMRVQKFSEGHRIINFPNGSVVMAMTHDKTGKGEARYEGPFTVVRRTQGGTYCNESYFVRKLKSPSIF